LDVLVIADFIPRSLFGRCCAFFAYLRFIFAASYIILFHFNDFDLIYVDQISAPIPLLKMFGFKVIFYAHFPDMLLSKPGGILKKLYRFPIDFVEKFSLSFANAILYNSKFTGSVYQKYFDFVKATDPIVLYPVPNINNLISSNDFLPIDISDDAVLFLSINRYEHKKNIDLALKAFALLRNEFLNSIQREKLVFVHFGGYDELCLENEEVFAHLQDLIESLQIGDCAFLLKSCSNDVKVNFLKRSTALLYTPSNEHFGIVPLEAMFLKCPVIAVNSGGPLETVVDGETGFLCDPEPGQFSKSMKRLVTESGLKNKMGLGGHLRVSKIFSFQAFQESLNQIVADVVS